MMLRQEQPMSAMLAKISRKKEIAPGAAQVAKMAETFSKSPRQPVPFMSLNPDWAMRKSPLVKAVLACHRASLVTTQGKYGIQIADRQMQAMNWRREMM